MVTNLLLPELNNSENNFCIRYSSGDCQLSRNHFGEKSVFKKVSPNGKWQELITRASLFGKSHMGLWPGLEELGRGDFRLKTGPLKQLGCQGGISWISQGGDRGCCLGAPHQFQLSWAVLIQPLLLAGPAGHPPKPLLRVIPRIYTPAATGLVRIIFHEINFTVLLWIEQR